MARMVILLSLRPMSITAGSKSRSASSGARKRRNIHGYTVTVADDVFRLLQRLGSATLAALFRQAREHGLAQVVLEGVTYHIHRHADHTFAIELRDNRHHPAL